MMITSVIEDRSRHRVGQAGVVSCGAGGFLPHLISVLIEKVELDESLAEVKVCADGVAVRCPSCGQDSRWEHI